MQSDNRHAESGSQACVLERVTTEHTYEIDHTNVSIALRLDTEMSQQADKRVESKPWSVCHTLVLALCMLWSMPQT